MQKSHQNFNHERYLYSKVTNKSTFNLNSDFLNEDIDFIIKNEIQNISISSYNGYKLSNIDFIKRLPFIKDLTINIDNIDVSSISILENLEELAIVGENIKMDFSRFISLKKLYLTYSKKQIGFEKLINLETLLVSDADDKLLNSNVFNCYYKLKNLELIKPKKFSLKDIIFEKSIIEKLEISYTRELLDLTFLLPINKTLKELRLQNCKDVKNHEKLSVLLNLEIIVFTDCNAIENSSFVASLYNLKQLSVLGKSFFIDGNIHNLKRPGLTIGIDNKKHYTMKSNQFLNYFRNPPEPMP